MKSIILEEARTIAVRDVRDAEMKETNDVLRWLVLKPKAA